MNRILVIGASGFVGKATLQALLKKEAGEAHAVYFNRHPQEWENVTWHKANVLDESDIARLMVEVMPTHLVQLAWCAEHGVYWKDHNNLAWLTAGIQIARHFVKQGGQRCLFLGTSAEYDWSGSLPLHEFTSLLKPQGLYGGSKLGLYWALNKFFEQEGISWVWGRLFNPFGAGEDPRRLIPKTCIRLLKGEHIQFDAGLSLRDFLHVNDVGSALATALLSTVTGPVNIGSGEAIAIREVISGIAANYGRTELVSFEPAMANTLPDAVIADVNRLQNECGWKAGKGFDQRLKETCEWWRTYEAV